MVGDWQVDPERLKIRLNHEAEKPLSPRAMAVLVALAEADGRVVHKNDLLDKVWPRAEVTQGVLSQAILELRNAFGDQSNDPQFIETVRGRGFRLIPRIIWNTIEYETAEAGLKNASPGFYRQRWFWSVAIACFLAIAVAVIMQIEARPPLPLEPTMLIVPFEDLSEAGDQGYLARGMAEEIAVQLSAAPQLKLLTNRAFSPYLVQADDPLAIATEFGVDLILTGSVQTQNDRIKMVAELSDARSAQQLWVSSFNRPRDDIYAIQNEVAQSIASMLLGRGMLPRKSTPVTGLHVYDYYLQGREYLAKVNPSATAQAIGLFEQALTLDANYAPARASLAQAFAMQGFLYDRDDEKLAAALEQADRAIDRNPDLADAYYARALALMGLARFKESHLAIQRAALLSPSHVDAVFLSGALADMRGDLVGAVNAYRRALELNPRLPRTVALARIFYLLGDDESALTVGRRGVFLAPGAPTLYFAHLMSLMERHDEALEHCHEAIRLHVPRAENLCGFSALLAGNRRLAKAWLKEDWEQRPQAQWGPFTFAPSSTHLAVLELEEGDNDEALSLLQQSEAVTLAAIEGGNDHWALRYNLAAVASMRGETTVALRWLDDAYENGFRDHRLLVLDPALLEVRNTPEFKRLQRRIGFDIVQAAEQLDIQNGSAIR